MSRKIGNAQSRATFFRHSAVLSLPAVLLRKLPNVSCGLKMLTSWLNKFKQDQPAFILSWTRHNSESKELHGDVPTWCSWLNFSEVKRIVHHSCLPQWKLTLDILTKVVAGFQIGLNSYLKDPLLFHLVFLKTSFDSLSRTQWTESSQVGQKLLQAKRNLT